MSGRIGWTLTVCGLAILCTGSACTVSPSGGGGIAVEFKIGGQTFRWTFGDAGAIRTDPGKTVNQVGEVRLWTEAPVDTPPAGVMRLRSSSVSFARADTATSRRMQDGPVSGTAAVRFRAAP